MRNGAKGGPARQFEKRPKQMWLNKGGPLETTCTCPGISHPKLEGACLATAPGGRAAWTPLVLRRPRTRHRHRHLHHHRRRRYRAPP